MWKCHGLRSSAKLKAAQINWKSHFFFFLLVFKSTVSALLSAIEFLLIPAVL